MKSLRLGSRGPMVEFLQNILQKLNLYSGKIDGIFGQNTKNAVIQFQKQNNLVPDGIVGFRTWNALKPYINGALGFIVPTNINYSSSILKINLDTLKELYPFLEITSVGNSVLGKELPVVKIGNGSKKVFYSASIHANEWITSPVLMKFLADYCYSYVNNLNIYGYNARRIFNYCTIYIMPMINPDGVSFIFTDIYTYFHSCHHILQKYDGSFYANFNNSSISISSLIYLQTSFNFPNAKCMYIFLFSSISI